MILLEDLDDVALLVGHHCLLNRRILGDSQALPWGAGRRTRGVRAETVGSEERQLGIDRRASSAAAASSPAALRRDSAFAPERRPPASKPASTRSRSGS